MSHFRALHYGYFDLLQIFYMKERKNIVSNTKNIYSN